MFAVSLRHFFAETSGFDSPDQVPHNLAVSSAALFAAMSVMCEADEDERISAAFNMLDQNGDGQVDQSELTAYLQAVFGAIGRQRPKEFERLNTTPNEVATVTAAQCFREADLDGDGFISFDEFQEWYRSPSSGASQVLIGQSEGGAQANTVGAAGQDDQMDQSVMWARQMTGLGSRDVVEVLDAVKRVAGGLQELDRSTFRKYVSQNGGGQVGDTGGDMGCAIDDATRVAGIQGWCACDTPSAHMRVSMSVIVVCQGYDVCSG